MKISFEDWYQSQTIHDDAKALFDESVKCHRICAYRAAYLMAYLGFQTMIKNRILSARVKPSNISLQLWEKTQRMAAEDNEWDNAVFEAATRIKPDNIFLVNDDIRRQYAYFRDIRNDCAHAKSNVVSYPHVETLWLFIQSNGLKFVVNGGKSSMMERLKKHFDSRYTAPGTDITPLIDDLPHSMNADEMTTFLMEYYNYIENEAAVLWMDDDEDTYVFWKSLSMLPKCQLKKAFIDFIKSDWSHFEIFLTAFPYLMTEIIKDTSFCREYWSSKIGNSICSTEGYWEVVRILLQYSVIPEPELDDFIARVMKAQFVGWPRGLCLEQLKSTKYFLMLRNDIFFSKDRITGSYGVDHANTKWVSIKFYLENTEIDDEVCVELAGAYRYASYGKFFEGMETMFKENNEFKESFIAKSSRLGLELCHSLSVFVELE